MNPTTTSSKGKEGAPEVDVSPPDDTDVPFQNVFAGECEKANYAVDPRCFNIASGEAGNCAAGMFSRVV
jgi:hypothetical protein